MSTLRKYQKEAIDTILDKLSKGVDKQLLVLATGAGKTKTAVSLSEHFKSVLFVVDSEELLEQAAMAFLREKFDESLYNYIKSIGFIEYVKEGGLFAGGAYKAGCIKADIFRPHGNVVIASVQTLHRRLDKIDPNEYDLVIVDEAHCFPKGTIVDGIEIEKLSVGDVVRSFNHVTNRCELKKITGWSKHVCENDLVEIFLENGKSILCTDNHPIYTKEYGYVKAKSVCFKQMGSLSLFYEEQNPKNNRNELFRLQKANNTNEPIKKGVFFKISKNILLKRVQENKIRHVEKGLQSSMQNLQKRSLICYKGTKSKIQNWSSLLQQRMLWSEEKDRHAKNKSFCRQRENVKENEGEKSNVQFRCETKNDSITSGSNLFIQRRERSVNKTPNDVAFSDWATNGVLNRTWRRKTPFSKRSKLLQSRPSLSRREVGYRSRWQNSQIEEMDVFRQKENRNSSFFRVDSYKVYKRGSREYDEKMRQENYVYNIEVEGNSNYFVNGILVHNCSMANTFQKAINHFTPKLRLGLSATPYRLDGLPLSDLFSEIVYEYNIDSGIKDGYLVELNGIRIKTSCSLDNVKTLGGEFNQKDLSFEINTPARNYQIADSYIKYALGRKTLGFGIDIQHCLDLAEAFQEKGINASAVSSDEERTGDRTQKIKDFKSGKIDVLFNANMLTKGFDEPAVSCIITGAPTKSLARYLQIIGRGTRTLPGVIDGLETAEERIKAIINSAKKDCLILDIVDSTTKHSIVNTWEIDKHKPVEDRIFVSKENKEKLLLERFNRSVKLQHVREEDEAVNLLSLPEYKIKKIWKSEESATPAQLAAISKWGYDTVNTHYTKSMIQEIFGQQPATEKQVWALKKAGYNITGFVSVAVANLAFKQIRDKEEKDNIKKKINELNKKNPFKF